MSPQVSLHGPHQHLDRDGNERPDDCADEAGQQPDDGAVHAVDRRLLRLLQQIGRDHAAEDDPEAARAVADRNHGQRRERPDYQSAEQRRLQLRCAHQDLDLAKAGLATMQGFLHDRRARASAGHLH